MFLVVIIIQFLRLFQLLEFWEVIIYFQIFYVLMFTYYKTRFFHSFFIFYLIFFKRLAKKIGFIICVLH